MPYLCTTIDRDGLAQDVTVQFSAEMTNPGYPASRDEPGEGPEYRCEFESAELDFPDVAGGPLTEEEMEALYAKFLASEDKVYQAANDNQAGWL